MHISGLENLKRTPVILTIRRSCPPSRLPIKADKANFAPQQLGSFCKSEGRRKQKADEEALFGASQKIVNARPAI